MKPTLVYVVPPGPLWEPNIWQFVGSYNTNPPEHEHDTIIVCNGHAPSTNEQVVFSQLPGLEFYVHDNSGYDIGAYQAVAKLKGSGLMLFCGSSVWFPKPGWMRRVVESYGTKGENAIYGAHGNTGHLQFNVFPHVRTTGFWLDAGLLNRYPVKITTPHDRYPFEHGPNSLTQWVRAQGFYAWIVAHGGIYALPDANNIPNGFQRGDQSNLILRDRLTEPPFYVTANRDILSLSRTPGGQFVTPGGGNRA